MSQITPYLWTENSILKKENINWIERTITTIENKQGNKVEYLSSKTVIENNGNKKTILYNKSGGIKETNLSYFKNEFIEVYKSEDGDKEVKEYDKKGNLISETWIYPDNSKDETKFIYKNNKLIKIIQKDEFETLKEELKYLDSRLHRILSIDEGGDVTMERQVKYDNDGDIKETHRIQEGKINKTTLYHYDDKKRLILKEEKTINRLSGEKMSPEIFKYTYHKNGVLKEERWIIYNNESKTDIKYEDITIYNEIGLEIKEIRIDYIGKTEEVSLYNYKTETPYSTDS